MARGQLAKCMFCDSMPCECDKPEPKKPPLKRVVRIAQAPVLQADKKEPEVPVETPSRQTLSSSSTARDAATEQREYRRALTLLCTELPVCSEDIQTNADDLNLTPLEIRTLIWKRRREEFRYDKSTGSDT